MKFILCLIYSKIRKHLFLMLSQDYFGFGNQNRPPKGSKKLKRTELSHQRLQMRKSQGLKIFNHDIEKLRNKYNAVNQQNNMKKSRKPKAASLSPNNFCYNSMKLKYLHYKQQLPSGRYLQIRKKFEKRILGKTQNKIQKQSKNGIPKHYQNNQIHIPNLMSHLRKGKHHEDFSDSSLNKFTDSSGKKMMSKSKLSKNSLSSTSQLAQTNKGNNEINHLDGREYLTQKQTDNKQPYILGICTLKKDNQISPCDLSDREQKSINNALSQIVNQRKPKEGISGLRVNLATKQYYGESVTDLNENPETNSKSNEDNLKIAQYKMSSEYQDPYQKYELSDYQKIKMLEKKQSQSIVNIFKKQMEDPSQKSEYHMRLYNDNQSNQLSFADKSESSRHVSQFKNQNFDKNHLNCHPEPKIYNSSRIIYNQSNVSANQSSFCYKIHEIGANHDTIPKTSQKSVENINLLKNKQSQIIQQKNSQSSESRVYSKISSKMSNKSSLLSEIIGSSEKPDKKIVISGQIDIYQTGTFNMPKSRKIGEEGSQKQKKPLQTSVERMIKVESSGLSKIIQYQSPSPFNIIKGSKQPSKNQKNYLLNFNLVESIRFINDYEDEKLFTQFSSSSKQLPSKGSRQINQRIDEVINAILDHLQILSKLGQFVKMKDEIYENQTRNIYEVQSFFVFRKFVEERKKIRNAILDGDASAFKLTNKEVIHQNLRRFKKDSRIVSLGNKIQECNNIIENTLKEYRQQIMRKNIAENLAIGPFTTKQTSKLFSLLDQQMGILYQKLNHAKSKSVDSQVDQEVQVMSIRAFSLMQLVFLLSEIQGRKVKNVEEEIQTAYFGYYLQSYKHLYGRTIQYFVTEISQ